MKLCNGITRTHVGDTALVDRDTHTGDTHEEYRRETQRSAGLGSGTGLLGRARPDG